MLSRRSALGWAALVALLPLGYYFSYLLVSIAGEHRYMYPATVLVQVATLASGLSVMVALAGHAIDRLRRRRVLPQTVVSQQCPS